MGKIWSCSACSSVFHRLDHYKRHLDTHTSDKPFTCIFCGVWYKRRDVLRRHWKSCSTRKESGQSIPQREIGGKDKSACDGCARLKKSCSGEEPCAECTARRRQCTYRRLLHGSQELEPDSQSQSGEPFLQEPETNPNETTKSGSDPGSSAWTLGPQTFFTPPRHVWVTGGAWSRQA